jgi:DNA-binding MarR family transcriptional regulator
MDTKLKREYIQVLFRFKKAGLDFPKISDVNMTELFVMAGISNNAFFKDKSIDLTEIQNLTHITKAAISLMFTSLEKRGYVIRETDRSNRRRITVELTTEGEKVLAEAQTQVDLMLDQTLSRLGEEKAWQLISLLHELSDISDELKNNGVSGNE